MLSVARRDAAPSQVYNQAMAEVVSNSTFSDAECTDYAGGGGCGGGGNGLAKEMLLRFFQHAPSHLRCGAFKGTIKRERVCLGRMSLLTVADRTQGQKTGVSTF